MVHKVNNRLDINNLWFYCIIFKIKVKGKVLPYLLLSVWPGADPGVQAVSPQVTF